MMIDPSTILIGNVSIGSRTYIGPYCIVGFPSMENTPLTDSLVEPNNRPTSRGAKIGSNSTLLSHIIVGEDTTIGSMVWCDHHCHIGCGTQIADGVQIMYGARIYNRVIIGEQVWIGGFVCNDAIIEANAVVLGQLIHKFVDAVEGEPEQAPLVQKGAFIGMGAIIIGGIVVGEGAYIGAGTVLTKSALPGRLYVGVPARDIGPAPRPFKSTKED